MNKALRVPDYLGHIIQAIERIDRYTVGMDEVAFLNSELVQDAVIRNIEIIGEASPSQPMRLGARMCRPRSGRTSTT